MNLLKKLTIKNLKLNKRRTIVTIIGIILSIALLTAVSSMYTCSLQALINFEKTEKGNFHLMLKNIDKEDVTRILKNEKVKSMFLTEDIGYSYLKESKNYDKPYIYVKGFTKDALENLSINLVEGRLPLNENEILIPTHLKTNGKVEYKIGDNIKLSLGNRILYGKELNQDDPYFENEEVKIKEEKEYKIVGIIERPANNIEPYSSPGYTFITLVNEENIDRCNIYILFTKKAMKNYYNSFAQILNIDAKLLEKISNYDYDDDKEYIKDLNTIEEMLKYDYEFNEYLIILESDPLSDSLMEGLGTGVLIVCIIIIITSVFCIKNSFDISIVEKTKQYAILKSIGATKKQIRKNVLFEAFILGLIGIPLGILLGLLATFILCRVCNYLLLGIMIDKFNIPFIINLKALIFSCILGIITIYLSSIRCAYKASRISLIDSIRNSGNIKIKKIKNSKIITKLFGIGGEISYKNMQRNKKKYRTTIISIIVSTTVFIALTYFVSVFYQEFETQLGSSDYNLEYSSVIETKEDFDKLNKVINSKLVDEYAIIKTNYLDINEPKIKDESYFDDSLVRINIIAYDEYQFNKYLKKLNIKNFDLNEAILFDYFKVDDKEFKHILDYKKGDNIDIVDIDSDYNESIKSFKIGAIVEDIPFGLNIKNTYYPLLIMSMNTYNENFKDIQESNVLILSSDANKLQDYIEKEIYIDDTLYTENIAENVKMVNNLLLLICIFLYGFVIVVTLIGVTNIFNTITTNMELRKQEFATLKSIGMTKKEFIHMIRLESIFICLKALIISIILGSLISYFIYYSFGSGTYIKFNLPYKAIIYSILAVILLIYIIMRFSISKINKQNIIETIRNENI